jgi:hypothetical protein
MPKPKAAPLSERLVSVTKGAAAPAPEPGRPRREPIEKRVSMTFRIRADDYEFLRRAAFDARTSQQALVDQAIKLLRNDGRMAT